MLTAAEPFHAPFHAVTSGPQAVSSTSPAVTMLFVNRFTKMEGCEFMLLILLDFDLMNRFMICNALWLISTCF